jgi:hypothetical protein
MMASQLFAAVLVGYLPGALLFRLPVADRARRAALPADERVFWHVVLSLAWSLAVVLVLAVLERYTFPRLLFANGAVSLVLLAAARGRVRDGGAAARPTWQVVLPLALVALGAWRYLPPSEFVLGGQDPGIYMNEGIQIAQRGGIVTRDRVVAELRPELRDLFIPPNREPDAQYYGLRFVGFFVQNPATGEVIGQFPHLYPASIAIGYGLDGLTGARRASAVWAILGLLAVYFTGRRLVGWPAAFAAATLLGLHVILTWYAKEPNAEVVMLTLLFAGTLAFARAHQDDDRFFGPAAGVILGLLLFLRVDALMVFVAVTAAAALAWIARDQRPRLGFVLSFAAVVLPGWWYLTGPMRGYMGLPQAWLAELPVAGLAAAFVAVVGGAVLFGWLRRRHRDRAEQLAPGIWAIVLLVAAAYALFLREPDAPGTGPLTDYNAYALRTFTDFYLTWPALVAALAGLVVVARRWFWRDPALLLTFAAFALFFFYKIRIVETHFWMSRRFLPVILPMALLLAAAAAMGPWGAGRPRLQALRMACGAILLAVLGAQYAIASAPLVRHVEYAGAIPYLERLASRFTERDLILVEARDASDLFVLATPLAYIYARPVLVLASAVPDPPRFRAFLGDAQRRYDRVFFLGGGGTELLSRDISATPVGGDTIQVPEYDERPWNEYPDRVDMKEFDYSIYLLATDVAEPGPFVLDVGFQDDLHVLRFHAKERDETVGRTVRWTGPQSFVSVTGLVGDEREVVLLMHDGGRPAGAPQARVEVFFDEVPLGTIDVGAGFRTYRLALPAEVVEQAADRAAPTRLRMLSTTWVPAEILGGSDTRELGVMLDRVEIR